MRRQWAGAVLVFVSMAHVGCGGAPPRSEAAVAGQQAPCLAADARCRRASAQVDGPDQPTAPAPTPEPHPDAALCEQVRQATHVVRGRVSETGTDSVEAPHSAASGYFAIVDVLEVLVGNEAAIMPAFRARFPVFEYAIVYGADGTHANTLPGLVRREVLGHERRELLFVVSLPSPSEAELPNPWPSLLRQRFGAHRVVLHAVLAPEQQDRIAACGSAAESPSRPTAEVQATSRPAPLSVGIARCDRLIRIFDRTVRDARATCSDQTECSCYSELAVSPAWGATDRATAATLTRLTRQDARLGCPPHHVRGYAHPMTCVAECSDGACVARSVPSP